MTTDKPRPAADAPAGSHSLGALTPTGNAAIKGIFFIMFAAALYFAKGLLIPVVLAVLVWLTFGPWVRWLAKRRMPSALSAAFIVIGLTVVVSGAAFVASGPVARWMDDIPKMSSELRSKLSELRQPMEEVAKASDALEEVGKNIDGKKAQQVVVRGPGLLFTLAQNAQYMATTVAATLVLLYFMLASGSHFHVRLVESFDSLADKKKALELVMLIENDVSRYLMSVTVINFCLVVGRDGRRDEFHALHWSGDWRGVDRGCLHHRIQRVDANVADARHLRVLHHCRRAVDHTQCAGPPLRYQPGGDLAGRGVLGLDLGHCRGADRRAGAGRNQGGLRPH